MPSKDVQAWHCQPFSLPACKWIHGQKATAWLTGQSNQYTTIIRSTGRVEGQEEFHTVMPAPALLGKDATYWQSVHQAGRGLMLERQEAASKEKEAWQAKVSLANATMYL